MQSGKQLQKSWAGKRDCRKERRSAVPCYDAQMPEIPLTIGRLANNAQVNVETIRYYQRVGLIIEPIKPNEGFRIYPDGYISRVKFIKRAQELGFTLKEIQDLLDLGDGNCKQVKDLAEKKLSQIEERLHDLNTMKNALLDLVKQCKTDETNIHCALIEVLNQTK